MKQKILLVGLFMACSLGLSARMVKVETQHLSLVMNAENGRHPQYVYFGSRLADADLPTLPVPTGGRMEVYPAYGLNTPAEAALAMRHADGNLSTDLVATGVDVQQERNVAVTTIHLKDPVYPIVVLSLIHI